MKKIIITVLLCAPMIALGADPVCKNQNILAYYTPETMTTQDKVVFYVPSFVKLSSFQATLNGKAQPVQYKNFGFLTRAKVIIPAEISGIIQATIGAESFGSTCNEPISFTFSR